VLFRSASLVAGGTSGETNAWTGIYGSKNAFAGAAATFTILALGAALGVRRRLWRAVALFSGAFGLGLVLLAQSAGTLVLLTLTLWVAGFLLLASRLSRARKAALLGFAILIGTALPLWATAHVREISAFLLDATGKDLTLTGRTELWAAARILIAERPLFGVGYMAFWVRGNAEAEALWHMFGIESRSGFNFHSMYLSNAVEIGVIGVVLQTTILFGAGVFTALWTLRTGAPVAATLFALTFMAILGSVIEVPLFFQFSLRTVLVIAAFHYARQALAAGR
jgi:exopolysaccharide production protein ExoQ